jgi:hypothetical protein
VPQQDLNVLFHSTKQQETCALYFG